MSLCLKTNIFIALTFHPNILVFAYEFKRLKKRISVYACLPRLRQGFQPLPIGYGGHDAGQAAFSYFRLCQATSDLTLVRIHMKKIIIISAAFLMHMTITPKSLEQITTPKQLERTATPEQLEQKPVKLISISSDAEKTMAYIARVSNPANQENSDYARLLKYCIKHGHWSVFEQATMTLEVETSLAIGTQLLRHRSFTFQQFSQRYADATALAPSAIPYILRRQDTKNRQNSIDDIAPEVQAKWQERIAAHNEQTMKLYQEMLADGVAKESARMVLPQATPTRLYMTGNIRSWIHYINARTNPDTQAEHREIAEHCKAIFVKEFPILSEALGWTTPTQESKT